MADGSRSGARKRDTYAAELVRWNRQINLVSRQDTERRVDELLDQCDRAWRDLEPRLDRTWAPDADVLYFDLGSGGGLPGVVWHHQLVSGRRRVQTVLVEPREKRAWFLERQIALDPAHPFIVHNARWGERGPVAAVVAIPRTVLISLKALHLPEPAVLRGFEAATAESRAPAGAALTIVRFAPPDQAWDDALASSLGTLWPSFEGDRHLFKSEAREVISPGPGGTASLIMSSYRVAPKS